MRAPRRTHVGTLVSLGGFILLGVTLFLPIGLNIFYMTLYYLDVWFFETQVWFASFPYNRSLPFYPMLVTGGTVAQVLFFSAVFATLRDWGRRDTPNPGAWRIIAYVLPVSGWFYALYALFTPNGLFTSPYSSPFPFVLLFLIPIFGFLLALAGTLWQRQIARRTQGEPALLSDGLAAEHI